MASNKSKISNVGGKKDASLGGALLTIIAAGVAGGALLISGAKALGEFILDEQKNSYTKLEEKREADKEAVRRIMENEISDN